MKSTSLRLLTALIAAGMLFQLDPCIGAESPDWESAVTMMKRGANQMIEGRNLMQQKKDLGSAENDDQRCTQNDDGS